MFTGGTNYNDQNGTAAIVINKANATIVVAGYNVVYDGQPHTASATLTGVNEETGATVGVVDVSDTEHTDAGSYIADQWTFTGTNYNSASGVVDDVIARANAVVVVTPYTVTYDGQPHSATVTSISGVNGETGTLVGTVSVAGTTHTNAGTYAADLWTFTATANYNNSNGTVNDVIARASATVVVVPYNVTYDGLAHAATVTSITGVNGETDATVGTVNLTGTIHTNAGTYNGDTWTFAGANYLDTGGTVDDAIAKADATIVVTGYSVVYNGLPHTASFTVTGVNGEAGATVGVVDVSGTGHTQAGTYSADPWTFTGTNYNSASGVVDDVIARANAVVVVTPYTVTYDGQPHSATVTSISGVNGETGTLVGTVSVAGTTHTNAGTYAADLWTFTATANYNNSNGTVNDVIARASATVVVVPYNVTYDGLAHTATVTSITGVNGETGATVGTVSVAGTTHTNAGTYGADPWIFTAAANYNDASGTVIDVIAKATPTVVATPYNVAYDGNPHTAGFAVSGVLGETGVAVGVINVFGTTHTLPGKYDGDPWTFTGSANYNNANGTVDDRIGYGTCAAGYGPGGVILQPINSNGTSVYNRKGGSTIPVKFTVCDAAGMPIANPAAVFASMGGALTMLSAVRGTVDVVNEPGVSEIPDVAFRWAGDKWIFNMSTSNLQAGTTYTFGINLSLGNITFRVGVK